MGSDGDFVESTHSINTMRTRVCLVWDGISHDTHRSLVWTEGAQEFIRRLYKKGVSLAVIGPRPDVSLGSKKHLKYFDRHEVITLKELARAKAQSLELKILGRKLRAWTRLRTDICVVSGTLGVWPQPFPGWTSSGVVTLDAMARFVNEYNFICGRRFMFLGSSNRVFRWACQLLDLGIESCTIVEPESELKCWRAYRDRFLAKGGRIFTHHAVERLEQGPAGVAAVYLRNAQGTMILESDTVVLSALNQEGLNDPEYWKRGLFYVQRLATAFEHGGDEENWQSRLDWQEVYWRVAGILELEDHGQWHGNIEKIRVERRKLFQYRKNRFDLPYNGKNLAREGIKYLQSMGSAPVSFQSDKPLASLECAEPLPCRACVDSCPHGAIEKATLTAFPKLLTDKCVGCGACVAACPAGVAVMVQDLGDKQMARYFLPDDSKRLWRPQTPVQVLNRRGDLLGSGQVLSTKNYHHGLHRVIEVEARAHNLWDVRTFRPLQPKGEFDEEPRGQKILTPTEKVWITLNGAKRLCPTDVPVTVALWQMGYRRFNDALFCADGGCRLCKIKIDGRSTLACQEKIREGCNIEFEFSTIKPEAPKTAELSTPSCYCQKVEVSQCLNLLKEGVPENLVKELTGFSQGTCRGRWCVSRPCDEHKDVKLRPKWPGFEGSPWHELWLKDILNN